MILVIFILLWLGVGLWYNLTRLWHNKNIYADDLLYLVFFSIIWPIVMLVELLESNPMIWKRRKD